MHALGQGAVPGQMVERLERAFGIDLPPGYTPGLVPMQHLWEPLRVMYRWVGSHGSWPADLMRHGVSMP